MLISIRDVKGKKNVALKRAIGQIRSDVREPRRALQAVVPQSTQIAIDHFCKQFGMSRSEFIRKAVKNQLQRVMK